MILFPAIDLKGGRCVRLRRGVMAEATVYNEDPAAQAETFAAQGFEWLHVVDLDGAFAGTGVNRAAIQAILKAVGVPIQLGGGIRSLDTVERWLSLGRNPRHPRNRCGQRSRFGPCGLQCLPWCRRGRYRCARRCRGRRRLVNVSGDSRTNIWRASYEDAGIAAIIYTDIDRDGMLAGLNIAAALKLAQCVSVPVIVSGGLASLADVRRLLEPDCARLAGAIIGRALYDGKLAAADALRLVRELRKAAAGC